MVYLTKTIRRCCYSFALEAQSRVQLSITSRKCFIVKYLNNIVHFYHTYRIGVPCNSFAFNKRLFFQCLPYWLLVLCDTSQTPHQLVWNTAISLAGIIKSPVRILMNGSLVQVDYSLQPHTPHLPQKKISALCGAGLMIDFVAIVIFSFSCLP